MGSALAVGAGKGKDRKGRKAREMAERSKQAGREIPTSRHRVEENLEEQQTLLLKATEKAQSFRGPKEDHLE